MEFQKHENGYRFLVDSGSNKTVIIIDGITNKASTFTGRNSLVFFDYEIQTKEQQCYDIIKKYFNSPEIIDVYLTNLDYIVEPITKQVANDFLEVNDYKGVLRNLYLCYGIKLDNELVAVMCFSKPMRNLGKVPENSKNVVELSRFCCKLGYNYVNYMGILWTYFRYDIYRKNPNINTLYGYVNCMSKYGLKELREVLSFKFDSITQRNYYYLNTSTGELENRWKYRKSELISKYNCPEDVTEKNFMSNVMKFPRIYDDGKYKYKKNL